MASWFCRIIGKFTRRVQPLRIIGHPDNQLPDNWSSTVMVVYYDYYTKIHRVGSVQWLQYNVGYFEVNGTESVTNHRKAGPEYMITSVA